jgi:hypothetical protein
MTRPGRAFCLVICNNSDALALAHARMLGIPSCLLSQIKLGVDADVDLAVVDATGLRRRACGAVGLSAQARSAHAGRLSFAHSQHSSRATTVPWRPRHVWPPRAGGVRLRMRVLLGNARDEVSDSWQPASDHPFAGWRFFCSRRRSALLVERLRMQTRLALPLSPPSRSWRDSRRRRDPACILGLNALALV